MSKNRKTKRICFMGLLFAVAVVLSYIEGMVTIPGLPPGIKLGLSNIVTMYCVFFLGVPSAYTLAILKALSVLLMRGPTGALLSLLGGLVSVTVMLLLLRLEKNGFIKATYRQSELGPKRKYYYLTPSGQNELCSFSEQYRQLTKAINLLLEKSGGKSDE